MMLGYKPAVPAYGVHRLGPVPYCVARCTIWVTSLQFQPMEYIALGLYHTVFSVLHVVPFDLAS